MQRANVEMQTQEDERKFKEEQFGVIVVDDSFVSTYKNTALR